MNISFRSCSAQHHSFKTSQGNATDIFKYFPTKLLVFPKISMHQLGTHQSTFISFFRPLRKKNFKLHRHIINPYWLTRFIVLLIRSLRSLKIDEKSLIFCNDSSIKLVNLLMVLYLDKYLDCLLAFINLIKTCFY